MEDGAFYLMLFCFCMMMLSFSFVAWTCTRNED